MQFDVMLSTRRPAYMQLGTSGDCSLTVVAASAIGLNIEFLHTFLQLLTKHKMAETEQTVIISRIVHK